MRFGRLGMLIVQLAPFAQAWRITASFVKLNGSVEAALGISVEQSCAYAVQCSKSPPFSRYPNLARTYIAPPSGCTLTGTFTKFVRLIESTGGSWPVRMAIQSVLTPSIQ